MDASAQLREALERAGRESSAQAQERVYAALLRAVVLAPLAAPAAAVQGREPSGSSPGGAGEEDEAGRPPALLVEPQSDGTRAALAFTGTDALGLWAGADRALTLPVPELCGLALAGGIERLVIDPAGPVRVALGSWEVRRLAGGEAPSVQAGDRDRRLGIALPRAPLGAAFLSALRERLAARAEVTAAAVFEADPVRARRHLVVGLRLAEPAPEAALAALVDDLHPSLEPLAPDRALLNYARLVDAGPFPALEPEATVFRR